MDTIAYPGKHSEAEIQAQLWYFLRKRKIDARLEVPVISSTSGRRTWRLDIVIFNKDEEPICIVECKSWSDGYSRNAIYRTNNTKQIKKYKASFGLPVLVCARWNFIERTIEIIEHIIKYGTIPHNGKAIIKDDSF